MQDVNIKTTKERIAVLETKVDDLKNNVDGGFKGVNERLDDFIDCADKKYASKLTERIVFGMVSVIILAVLYYILSHVGITGVRI